MIYFFMGTSRQLAIGPEGVISLLTGAAVYIGYEETSGKSVYEYTVPRSACLTLLVGIFTLLLGITRVGFLDNLMSRPILHGFVSASAAIILVGQLDTFLGFHVPQLEWKKIYGVIQNIQLTNWYSFGIGATCIVVIIVLDSFIKKKLRNKIKVLRYVPTPLLIVATSTLVVYLTGWEDKGVAILVSGDDHAILC